MIERISDVKIPPNTGDFRLMSRRVVDHVVALREAHGFLRGLVGLVGFRQTGVLYDREARAAGTSKYNRFFGSLVIGLNGIVGFSRYPLQVISLLGIGLSGFAFCLAIAYFALTLSGHPFPVGNPTIVILVTFFSGIQLLSLGVMGEYVGRIYDEVRQRPKYIVESRYGFDEAVTPLPPVCILAGGLGTRLGERVAETPKPLLEVAGEPFLLHQLRLLARHGAERVVLCVGYLGERIETGSAPSASGSRSSTATTDPVSTARSARSAGRADCSGSGSWFSTATRTCVSTMARPSRRGSRAVASA